VPVWLFGVGSRVCLKMLDSLHFDTGMHPCARAHITLYLRAHTDTHKHTHTHARTLSKLSRRARCWPAVLQVRPELREALADAMFAVLPITDVSADMQPPVEPPQLAAALRAYPRAGGQAGNAGEPAHVVRRARPAQVGWWGCCGRRLLHTGLTNYYAACSVLQLWIMGP